jgi:hypothetical protein
LGGSLGAHLHLLPFFSTQIEFLNSIFRNDINSRCSARCCGTQDTEKRQRPKRTGKPGKKRLHILLDDTKKAFDGWEDLPELWTFETCEAYIEWCHIGKGFPHDRYKRRADKANMHHCEWPSFKERCIEMCQHIYEKPFFERNECPLSILRMVYVEVVLGKRVDWTTINIQTNSNMKAHLSPFFGKGRLTKKMPSKTSTPNNMVNHSPSSSDDEKTDCTPTVRRAILNSIKGQVVHNTLTEMVANESIEEPLLLQAIEEGDHGHGEEGEGSGPTMDEGFSDMEVPWNPFDKIAELEQELATSRALVEEYKLKNQELEEELVAQKNMVSRLSGNPI